MKPDRILIAEDEPTLRKLLTMQLTIAGYEVVAAADGAEALERFSQEPVDLVLLDVMMPAMDGYEVCRTIRADRRHAQVPIIFLTARDTPFARVQGLVDGANDYIGKPYEAKELLMRVKNMIAWSRAQRNANPLTGLPGNPSIEAEVERRLTEGSPFSFLYLDLDNFKAFNDAYSYLAGDGIIKLMARVLEEVVAERGTAGDFVGHVGGDDFVIITDPATGRAIGNEICDRFDAKVVEHYRPEDRERGYVLVENRRGELERFGLVSVTIALVESERYHIGHMAALNDIVAELKQVGKQTPGSVVVEDRRRPPEQGLRTGSEG